MRLLRCRSMAVPVPMAMAMLMAMSMYHACVPAHLLAVADAPPFIWTPPPPCCPFALQRQIAAQLSAAIPPATSSSTRPAASMAEVFAVGDSRDGPALAPLARLGSALTALGLTSPSPLSRPSYLAATTRFDTFSPPPPPPRAPLMMSRDGGRAQWHRLYLAWKMMEDAERANGSPFAHIIKLRFDATPLGPFALMCDGDGDGGEGKDRPSQPHRLVLHAATDKVFWGSRTAMAVAAAMHGAIGQVFGPVASPRGLDRGLGPVRVDHLLSAVLAVPHAAWSTAKHERQHYNKVSQHSFLLTSRSLSFVRPPLYPQTLTSPPTAAHQCLRHRHSYLHLLNSSFLSP